MVGKYESSNSMTRPSSLSTTCGISTSSRSTVLLPKVTPSKSLGTNEYPICPAAPVTTTLTFSDMQLLRFLLRYYIPKSEVNPWF